MPVKSFHAGSFGMVFAIAAPLFYSASIPLSKVFLNTVEPWMLAGLLDLGAGLGIAGLYGVRRIALQPKTTDHLQGKDWYWLGASIVAGGLLAPVLQAFGIAHSSAATASLLLNLEGVFTAVIAWVVFREQFNQRLALGLMTITLGSCILVWGGESGMQLSWGAIAIIGASLAWATTSNCTQKVSHRNPMQVVMTKTLLSGSWNVALALLIGNSLPSMPMLGTIGLAGFVCVGFTFICFILALRHIGTSRTGAFFSVFPFGGAALSVLFLQEPITIQLLSAAVLMALGLAFCLTAKQVNAIAE
jgi:drug/metabolite transporter (DMT)-like permease